jgi:hypothetical protein
MSSKRLIEPELYQGSDEEIAYVFDFTEWGTPSNPEATLVNTDSGKDVTDTNLSGDATVVGARVIMPQVVDLEAGMTYKLTCAVTINGNLMSAYAVIIGE